jgi:hypothetical protein
MPIPTRIFDGTGPFIWLGVASSMVGLAMLGAILMSPNGREWWMDVHSVHGREIDGLVYYTVNGVNYTVSDPQSVASSRPHERTVYFLSTQPSDGSLHNTENQVVDWASTVGPGAVGAIFLAGGFLRRTRHQKRARLLDPHRSFGHGIPSETIHALLERNRRSGS